MAAVQFKKLVLVVDDDTSVRTLISKALQAKGYDVKECPDGMAASEALGTLSRPPDLMICDVMMPTIDGFTLARLVKQHSELRTMPIIFLTALHHDELFVQRGYDTGAVDYLSKPFTVEALGTVLARWLPLRAAGS